jgi:hypothetical protein
MPDVGLLEETESDLLKIKCLISLIRLHANGNLELNSTSNMPTAPSYEVYMSLFDDCLQHHPPLSTKLLKY